MKNKQAETAIKAACIAGVIQVILSLFSVIVLYGNSGEVPFNPGVKIPFSSLYQFI